VKSLVNAIVTGGAGFVGSCLSEKLAKDGSEVLILDNLQRGKMSHISHLEKLCTFKRVDLLDHVKALDVIKDADVCFHLASHLGGINYMYQRQAAIADNFAINYNVFDACLKNDVPKIVFLSSACAYPTWIQTKENHPLMKEEMAFDPGALPESMYGWAKLMGELQLQHMVKEEGIKAAVLRPFNIYGPKETFDVEKGHVIPAFMVKALRKDDPFKIWGSGQQDRSFVYVTDTVKAILLAMELSDDATPINVGDPERITMTDLAKKVTDLAGYTPRFELETGKPEGVFSRGPDITRAREILGWSPTTSLDQGLAETWEWAKTHVKA